MSAIGVIVADTTPLNYLIFIDRTAILPALFGEVLIPKAVLEALRHPRAPEAMCRWLQAPPAWLRITPVRQVDKTGQLGKGETEALNLAVEQQVKVVLMDERKGRAAAKARGLLPVGTLNLIDLADEQRLLDGIQALHDLRQTTFRADPELLERFEGQMIKRRSPTIPPSACPPFSSSASPLSLAHACQPEKQFLSSRSLRRPARLTSRASGLTMPRKPN